MFKTQMSIGVKSYEFIKTNACGFEHKCACAIKFSFKLEGNFLGAALSDDIDQTVDYDELCQVLAENLTTTEKLQISGVRSIIAAFSSLISAGLVELEVSCSHLYLKDQCLL